MLLTSSQVSLLISSGIVISFTLALFLSGYAIQQRTLRDLRGAIQANREPRPSPKIYLPDRFKKSTTELEDGTVVEIDTPESDDSNQKDDIVIVRPTMPDEKPKQKPVAVEKDTAPIPDTRQTEDGKENGATSEQKPISRAERRRLIKEEIQRLSQGDTPVYYQRRLW
ncbi:hypothetical protein F4779DRAFT_561439 [Xylariaceae sp. FL0662B]|nr:hypothetical protein F4779DRAFT_561439 [Xylariaceae sp. FL0662B]